MIHCNQRLKAYDVWVLKDISGKTNRKIWLFQCDKCKKILLLKEFKSTKTHKFYQSTLTGKDAINFLFQIEKDVLVKESKLAYLAITQSTFGWVYGENKEVYDDKGNIIDTKMYACDFFGNKKEI